MTEKQSNRRLIPGGSEFEDLIGYSRAVLDGNYVFVSGTTGYDYASMAISDDPAEQAEQCLKNIDKALRDAGASMDRVVRVHYIFPNREDFKPCWPVFQKYFAKARPAATMFVADLLNDQMKVEIEVTAALD